MKTLLLSILFIFSGILPNPHPLHVSIMQIDHNEKERLLEITLKSFVDDMELALKNSTGNPLFLEKINPKSPESKAIVELIDSSIDISINANPAPMQWIGWEIDKDEIFLYFQVQTPKKIKSIGVKNNLLMREYDDQANIVHIKALDTNRSFVLEPTQSFRSITF